MKGIIDETYREINREVSVPGFRKGKVPRKVIDSHLGAEYVRNKAISNGLPTLYMMAVQDSGIMPVCDPEINLLDTDEEDMVVFEAKVDVKPEVVVEDCRGIVVERPETEVTDDDLKQALDEARDRFATLEVVEGRPVEEGDFVLFDYKVMAEGVSQEDSSGHDHMTEVGSEGFVEGVDEQLVGGRKGDILDIHVTLPPDFEEKKLAGKPATFRTMIKEIKRKVSPELTDDLVRQLSNLETVEEFKDDFRERIAQAKESAGERQVREKVVRNLVERTGVELPDSMVDEQVQREIEEFAQELEGRGTTLDEYLKAMKGTREQLEKSIREGVIGGLKAELVIDAVASTEGIEVSDEDIEEHIRKTAGIGGGDPEKAVEEARKQGRMSAVRASMRLSKAVDFLVEHSVFEGEEAGEAGVDTGGETPADEPDGEEVVEKEVTGEEAAGDKTAEKEETEE